MDESVIKHLAEQGALTLSAAIRIGCPWVKEDFIYSGCAIGAGYRVLTGRDLTDDWFASYLARRGKEPEELVAEAFRVPLKIVKDVSSRHYRREWSREQCADHLALLGY